MQETNFIRDKNLCNNIIILDGLTGTGKTMFAPLINSFERVQNSRFEYMIEYLCISAKKNKISEDAAKAMINLLADIKYYDGSISREVNFRPNDLSSVFSAGNWMKYIKQLFMSDGEIAANRLNEENPSLFFVTHQILSCIEPAFSAFGERLKVVQMIRHPLYLVDHWESYIEMHGNNARDFTLWIDYKNNIIPWFAEGWEEKYISSNSFEKSIYAIDFLMKQIFSYFNSSNLKKSLLFIPFEKFVINPNDYINKLEIFLDRRRTPHTLKVLKNQKVPRVSINGGPQKQIYKRYALKKHDYNESHIENYNKKIENIKNKCSVESFDILIQLNKEYEKYFGLWF
jgi:hypothetical protein